MFSRFKIPLQRITSHKKRNHLHTLMAKAPSIDLEAATREISKGYEISTQLHSLLRQVIPRGDGRLESAYRLSKNVKETLSSALSILKHNKQQSKVSDPLALEISLPCVENVEADYCVVEEREEDLNRQCARKRSLQSVSTITHEVDSEGQIIKTKGESKNSRSKLQKTHLNSWTVTTRTPFNDGNQWRKYGEKKISNCKMTRCYYRCTHKDDQGCPATKHVQQKDLDDPPNFVVTYIKQHTCKSLNQVLYSDQFVIDDDKFVLQPPITDPCQLSL